MMLKINGTKLLILIVIVTLAMPNVIAVRQRSIACIKKCKRYLTCLFYNNPDCESIAKNCDCPLGVAN
ncbi:unnamed protein product [Litomosoides sigmodontis]|uniref:ShKT domain-containing protein n=1 Tax=Litomosoides sigmodontis TaxID=42156 RepID=A0A3P6TLX5_LITSI|nr:unnamed protein product [Litomosoides sigmodontis]